MTQSDDNPDHDGAAPETAAPGRTGAAGEPGTPGPPGAEPANEAAPPRDHGHDGLGSAVPRVRKKTLVGGICLMVLGLVMGWLITPFSKAADIFDSRVDAAPRTVNLSPGTYALLLTVYGSERVDPPFTSSPLASPSCTAHEADGSRIAVVPQMGQVRHPLLDGLMGSYQATYQFAALTVRHARPELTCTFPVSIPGGNIGATVSVTPSWSLGRTIGISLIIAGVVVAGWAVTSAHAGTWSRRRVLRRALVNGLAVGLAALLAAWGALAPKVDSPEDIYKVSFPADVTDPEAVSGDGPFSLRFGRQYFIAQPGLTITVTTPQPYNPGGGAVWRGPTQNAFVIFEATTAADSLLDANVFVTSRGTPATAVGLWAANPQPLPTIGSSYGSPSVYSVADAADITVTIDVSTIPASDRSWILRFTGQS